jgi:ATP synthase protein I
MQSQPSHRGDLSQNSSLTPVHPSRVTARTAAAYRDPASRRTRGVYHSLSASSVGLELGIAVILSLLFGWWLDGKLGTEPWMMLVFLVVGLVAGFRGVLRAVERADAIAAREEEAHG